MCDYMCVCVSVVAPTIDSEAQQETTQRLISANIHVVSTTVGRIPEDGSILSTQLVSVSSLSLSPESGDITIVAVQFGPFLIARLVLAVAIQGSHCYCDMLERDIAPGPGRSGCRPRPQLL